MTESSTQSFLARLPEELERETIQATYSEAENIVQYIIYGSAAFSIFLAFWYDTWLIGLGVSAFNVIIYLISLFMIRVGSLHRAIVAMIFPIYAGLFLYQMHGLFEMHFVYLIYTTALIVYRNWRVYIYFSLLTAVHHLFFSYLQNSGASGVYFSQLDYISVTTLAFHIGLVVVNVIFSGWWARRMRNEKLRVAYQQYLLERQIKNVEKNIDVAEQIANGDLDSDLHLDEDDALGASLMDMRESLKKAAEQEKQRTWATEGVAKIEEILRLYNKDLEDLSFRVISTLTTYVGAIQGGIFILNVDVEGDPHLELTGCIAYNRKKYIQKRVEIGQGLVGQTYREKETLYLEKVPEDYVNITSGLGDTNPQSIVIVPLKMEDEVVGVIEMATFKKMEKYELNFLEQVAESIASIVISSKNNQKTQRLLEESQMLTEQMRAQEEEVRQNMEEMEATQEEMRRQQLELESKETNLNALINNTDDSIITIDKKYKVMLINDVLKRRYKGTQYESLKVGVNALDYLGSVRDEWKGYYDRALGGESLEFIQESSVDGEDTRYRQYRINPIRNHNRDIMGISVFSRDITDIKRNELENERLLHKLHQKEMLYDAIQFNLEANHEKRVLRTNMLLLEALGYDMEEVVGKNVNILFKNADVLTDGIEAIESGDIWEEEIELVHSTGSTIPVSAYVTSVKDRKGELSSYLMVFITKDS